MKDSVICFRIGKELRSALETISLAERRSLSSTIENVLFEYVGQKVSKREMAERRRHPRREVSVPALVSIEGGLHAAGTVRDISEGGIRLSMPRWFEAGERAISVAFSLPESEKILTVKCLPRHVKKERTVDMGASFLDDGGGGYEAVRREMMGA